MVAMDGMDWSISKKKDGVEGMDEMDWMEGVNEMDWMEDMERDGLDGKANFFFLYIRLYFTARLSRSVSFTANLNMVVWKVLQGLLDTLTFFAFLFFSFRPQQFYLGIL